jgi:hypothetical protein
VEAYALDAATTAFDESRARSETILAWLSGPESAGVTHAELEARLQVASRELFCQLVQDYLDLRAEREPRLAGVVDADRVPRDTVEVRARAASLWDRRGAQAGPGQPSSADHRAAQGGRPLGRLARAPLVSGQEPVLVNDPADQSD